jgi:hypothetical protein
MATATLISTVTVTWECSHQRGVERSCDVLAEYTFDGSRDLQIMAADIVEGDEPYGIDTASFDLLVDKAVAERASEAYGDWLSGQDGGDR